MSSLLAALLGLVQGLTEFFPVSSSAHLKLVKLWWSAEQTPLIFDLACHLGSAFALVWFLKKEITSLFRKEHRKLLLLFLALLPLIPAYFFLSPLREILSKPQFLGFFLMVTGGILWVGQRWRPEKKGGPLRQSVLIGVMQSAAFFPGISRSGFTISTARVLGWNAKEAVRFSFLLAIPTILGGSFLEMLSLWKKKELGQLFNLPCLIGFFTSLLVGLLVIRFAIKWLEEGKLKIFAWYCFIMGIIASLYIFWK